MTIRTRHNFPTAAALAAAIGCASPVASTAQEPHPGEPGFGEQLARAVLASPGALGIETGRTVKGRLVIFAWFENKKALVDWYQSDFHTKAVKWAFPNQTFDREPLPNTPENSGQILALVTMKFADQPPPGAATAGTPSRPAIESIGIELYTPVPGGVAVGGRFAPKSVKVPALREIDLNIAEGRAR
jgi:hypothetical protein